MNGFHIIADVFVVGGITFIIDVIDYRNGILLLTLRHVTEMRRTSLTIGCAKNLSVAFTRAHLSVT